MAERPQPPRFDPRDILPLMVESVRDYAIFMLDSEGRIITWNRGAERIKQYQAQEILGQHFSIFYPAPDVRARKPDYGLRVAAEVGRFEDEGWRVRKDGSRFWANVVITRVDDADGNLVGFGKVTRDLSERKRAEDEREILLAAERRARAQAEEAQERLQAIQEVSEAGLAGRRSDELLTVLVERIADVLLAECAVIFLREGDELVPVSTFGLPDGWQDVRIPVGRGPSGRATAEARPVIVDDYEHYDDPSPVLAGQGIRSLAAVPFRVDHEVRGVLTVASRLVRRFTGSDLALLEALVDRLALAFDRARAVEAEQTAQAEAFAAYESARLREEFMAVAAHELKTPLTSIRAGTQLALRRLNLPQPEIDQARSSLLLVRAQADRLGRLVAQLLEASRIEAGRFEMSREEADVAALVQEAVASAQQASERDVRYEGAERLTAIVDALRFEQVVMNLLDNAVKYSPKDTPIKVTLSADGEWFQVSVRDYGSGIDPAKRPRLFRRFYQAHSDSHESGLGLGLYISREIAEGHGGEITAEFPEDGGSRFIARFPLIGEAPEPATVEPAAGLPQETSTA